MLLARSAGDGASTLARLPAVELPQEPPPRLGGGALGSVYRETDVASGREVAVKYVQEGRFNATHLRRELASLHTLSHPHVVGLTSVHDCLGNLAVVTELVGAVPGQTLLDFVNAQSAKRASESQARLALAQVLSALSYAHGLGIVHRDLKCALVSPLAHPAKIKTTRPGVKTWSS